MEEILEFVKSSGGVWPLVVLFAAAALEYMLPMVPGDSIVLAGSLIVVAERHTFATVYCVAVAGGFLGALSHYLIGRALRKPEGGVRGQHLIERLTGRGSFDRFLDRLHRYGMLVIVINRMFPGIRSVTFIAAGAAQLPFARVMFFGLISNMGWSLALLLLGTTLGGNWEKIEATFAVYSRVLAIISGVLIASYIAYRLYKRVKTRL